MKIKKSSGRFYGKLFYYSPGWFRCEYQDTYHCRNFGFVIFKQPEKQMYGEGPVLLSTMAVKGQNILQQLRTDLIENVTKRGFK